MLYAWYSHATSHKESNAFYASYPFSLLSTGRQAGRQKRKIEKAWKLVERGYFTRVTLDAFAKHYSFTLVLLKIQNATTARVEIFLVE